MPGEKTEGPFLTKFSPIRFNKYEVGNTMRKHYDHIHSIFDGQMKGVPIVSIVANLNEDYEVRTVRVNNDGKKVRGKDLTWVKKIIFNNPKAFEESNIVEELKEHYRKPLHIVKSI